MGGSAVPSQVWHTGWRVLSGVVWGAAAAGAVAAVAGCSSDDAEPVTTGPVTTIVAEPDTFEPDRSGAAPTGAAGDAPAESVYAVAMDVSVGRLDVSEQLVVAIEPDQIDEIDPFTRFSSCSGLRASVGIFAVTAVDDTAGVRSVAVVTGDRVTGPGTYDADIRVETATGGNVSASGTVTLDDGLRSGSFEASEPTGERVSGTFTCDGPAGTPVPIAEVGAASDDDGVLRTVEVVALLRRGDQERIVGLALDVSAVATADAECVGSVGSAGGDGTSLVSVHGGPAVGAITAFDLAPERSPSMRLDVGGASYAVDDVEIDLDDRGAAGTFSGVTDDGTAIDGAFRCA